ncbi:MAG: TIGR01777 family oxidoreductase [Chlamydiota bacterium]|nr:TIGR01777 family oxidoreductase [Chlamydiota bacterium]
MKILIAGSSGLVGSELTKKLKMMGHEVLRLVRKKESPVGIYWNPLTGEVDRDRLEGIDVVINLAGENISNGRWTASKKKKIWDSRVLGTQNLSRTLSLLDNPPKVLINASAIGYYGDTGETQVTEGDTPGNSFLSKVCQEWEKATELAEQKGIRVVKLRIGVVLSPKGGALQKMLLPFKMCVGGKIGSGNQYMSWISLKDLVSIICFCIDNDNAAGPINAVAPCAVTNLEFTKTLGKVLKRPTFFPLPAFVARFLLGEMADELLLRGTRVLPEKLNELEYNYADSDLEGALQKMLS